MQQINYKCTSQQCEGNSHLSKNTLLSVMTIQLWNMTNLRRLKCHPHTHTLTLPLASPQLYNERGKICRVEEGREERPCL